MKHILVLGARNLGGTIIDRFHADGWQVAGGLGGKSALREDYVDELLQVGRRPGFRTVACSLYRNMPSLIAARSRYPEVKAPVPLVYGEKDGTRCTAPRSTG